jgi:cyclopropane-fatty-acyl-phospholipid synthase
MSLASQTTLQWTEQGYVPDKVIRHGIRRLLAERLIEISHNNCEVMADNQHMFIEAMQSSPVAVQTDKANEQHYEIPASFYEHVLGENGKYSCCYWKQDTGTLDEAEREALSLTCEHARLADGQQILELGCGWGSLTLWMARQYPNAHITAVSNSASQGEHIRNKAEQSGLNNVTVITEDMNSFSTGERYDRIVSVEMFEHMRNWDALYKNVASWLKPGGFFFKHIFVNRATPYLFLDQDDSDWMSRYFFSGGMMPSDDLPLYFQDDLRLARQWRWSGEHYEKTSNAWLANMDANKAEIWPILEQVYGAADAQRWWMRWRIFFMACAELFAYNNGQEWYVSHYLFQKR